MYLSQLIVQKVSHWRTDRHPHLKSKMFESTDQTSAWMRHSPCWYKSNRRIGQVEPKIWSNWTEEKFFILNPKSKSFNTTCLQCMTWAFNYSFKRKSPFQHFHTANWHFWKMIQMSDNVCNINLTGTLIIGVNWELWSDPEKTLVW